MSAALAYLEDDLPMPRRARHLYLVAVDGRIVERATPSDTPTENRSRTACVRTGTSALPLIDNVSYGIHSTASYDPKWGKPTATTDTNGNAIAYTYDNFGRTETVLGPQEQAAGQAYTIRFGYTPYVDLDQTPFESRAKTEHADRDVATNGNVSYKDPIETVLLKGSGSGLALTHYINTL